MAEELNKVKSYVYVVGFDTYVKIGYTTKFSRRKFDLQEGLPKRLETFLLKPGTMADERALHARFDKYRLRGEWFSYRGDLADWLEKELGVVSNRRRRRQAVAAAPKPPEWGDAGVGWRKGKEINEWDVAEAELRAQGNDSHNSPVPPL